MKAHVGDVVVVPAAQTNPYRPLGLIGDPRIKALWAFYKGHDTSEWAFWYAPCAGGARKITRDEVNWDSSGIEQRAASRDGKRLGLIE